MTNNPNLWDVRNLPCGLALEVHCGEVPALVLTRGENRVRLELAHANGVVGTLK
jgi:hypothetical protein